MGAYRSKPLTEKLSKDNESNGLMYGVSEMQGWRVSMEDAYTCLADFDEATSMFAVYDGHGGPEVAQYCANKLPNFIRDTEAYKNGCLKQSLMDAFSEIDKSIINEEVIEELKKLSGTDDTEDLDDAALLSEEATMPIEELLKRMKQETNATEFEKLLVNHHSSEEQGDDESSNEVDEENGHVEKQTNGTGIQEDKADDNSDAESEKENQIETEESTVNADEKNESNFAKINTEKTKNEKIDKDDNEDMKVGDNDAELTSEEDDDDDDDDEEDDGDDDVGVPESDEVGKDSGATAIVAFLREDQLTVANVGDSRCVLCRGKTAVDLSKDHKPEDETELERITKAGGKITHDGRVNGGLNLSRAIGDHNYKNNQKLLPHEQVISAVPDIEEVTLSKEDKFMILACDGIWNIMTSQEAVDFVLEKLQEQEKEGNICVSKICEDIFDHCLAPDTSGDGSGCDNMTCIIVLLNRTQSMNKSKKRTIDTSEDPSLNPEKKLKVN